MQGNNAMDIHIANINSPSSNTWCSNYTSPEANGAIAHTPHAVRMIECGSNE